MRIAAILLDSPIAKVADKVSPEWIFDRYYDLMQFDRDMWTNRSWEPEKGSQVWFTDGSKQDNMDTGAGVYGPGFQRALPMGKYPSVFQAEVFAIIVCAAECLRRGTARSRIYILSDSQAALRALMSYEVSSGIVMECIRALNQLGRGNSLTLGWIPGHSGHEGNERADCLANRGARRPFIGPEPFCGISNGYVRESLRVWRESEFSRYWENSLGQRQAKRFISFSSVRSRRLLSLDRGDLRTLSSYLTGHCNLRYHLHKRGQSDSDICRFCELVAETSEHVLCECPRLCDRRIRFLGGRFILPQDIGNVLPNRIIGFIGSLNL